MSGQDWSKAPEGATHYAEQKGARLPGWYMNAGGSWLFAPANLPNQWFHSVFAEDRMAAGEMIERPPAKAWSGEGLPPAGTACEAISARTKEYRECEVIAIRNGMAIVVFPDQEELQWATEFRPIRTAEQLAAEEREKDAQALFEIIHPGGAWEHVKDCARSRYRAAIDAGFRKQVAP